MKCEGKELSLSDQLTMDVIGVIRMSIQSFTKLIGIGCKSDDLLDVIGVIKMSVQSFTKLIGIGCKSDDLHGANRTRHLIGSDTS